MADIGVGIGAQASTGAVAVVGTVALALIGGHLISEAIHHHHKKQYWRHHRRQALHPHHGVMSHRHVMDSIYNECIMSASHPATVHKNRDRIYRAIHQRAPHVKELLLKGHSGRYGPHRMAEGIQNMSEDILSQFEIPQRPHESAANPRLVQAFKNQRHNDINYRYSVPGGLVLDPYERQYLDKEILSYAGEAGHGGGDRGGGHGGEVGDFHRREGARIGFESDRLRHYFGEREGRWGFRRERALAGLFPPWLLGDIGPVGPYYQPGLFPPLYPTYGPDLLHPGLYPGGGLPLIGPFIHGGFPDRLGFPHGRR